VALPSSHQSGGKYHTYRPKSDFLLMNYGLPRLAMGVNSQGQGRPLVDFFRPMLQGASIVRFANAKLHAYKNEKNFVFVAIYIHGSGQVDRYLLYQDVKIDSRNVRTHLPYILKSNAESK
jgi:hypothetical protein